MSDASALALCVRLIKKHGRSITFIEFSASLADPSKPWEGPADPRGVPARTLTTFGCFVEPDSLQRLGETTKFQELLQRSDKICLVDGTSSLEGYNEVLDGTKYFRITGIETLEPGSNKILNFVGIAR